MASLIFFNKNLTAPLKGIKKKPKCMGLIFFFKKEKFY
jgi:hypothetical protein